MSDTFSLQEALDNLESALSALEKTLHTGAPAGELVHQIFRLAHSLKGAVGLENLGGCIPVLHAFESAFDHIRKGQGTLVPGLLDQGFKTVDFMNGVLSSGNPSEAQAQEFLAQFSALGVPQAPKVLDLGMDISPEERTHWDRALAQGMKVWKIEKTLSAGLTAAQLPKLPIWATLGELGVVIAQHPQAHQLESLTGERLLRILFASTLTRQQLEEEIFDPFMEAHLPPQGPVSRDQKPVKILVVEDEFSTQVLLKKLLADFGPVEVAGDGLTGWEKFLEAQKAGQGFDFIILDMMMPKKNGAEFLADLRAWEESQGILGLDRCKIVINSAVGEMDVVKKAFVDQADGYLVKPLTQEKIRKALVRFQLWGQV